MSKETENFTALRRLVALKKQEAPPPGYFDGLASEIRARLAAGEHRTADLWQAMGEQASWLQRLWAAFAAKPAMAGAFGMAVCGLMVAGVYFSQEPETVSGGVAVADAWKLTPPTVSPLANSHAGQAQILAASSTNPVLNVPVGGSLFEKIGAPGQSAPVSFQPK